MKPEETLIVGLLVRKELRVEGSLPFLGTELFPMTTEELEALREMARAYLSEKQDESDENQHR